MHIFRFRKQTDKISARKQTDKWATENRKLFVINSTKELLQFEFRTIWILSMQTAVKTCEDKIFYLHWLLTNAQPTTLNLPAVNTVNSLTASWCCVSFIPSGQFLFLCSPGLQTKKHVRWTNKRQSNCYGLSLPGCLSLKHSNTLYTMHGCHALEHHCAISGRNFTFH